MNLKDTVVTYAGKVRGILKDILSDAFSKRIQTKNETEDVDAMSKFGSSMVLVVFAVLINLLASYLAVIHRRNEKQERVVLKKKELMQFPMYLSVILFGMFVFLKFLPKEYVVFVITAHVLFYGWFIMSEYLSHLVAYVWPGQLIPNRAFDILISENRKPLFEQKINLSYISSLVLVLPIVVGYYFTRSWILNDLIASSLCLSFVEATVLDRYFYTVILFGGLFFYDVFWVYGSNVMVTVAEKLHAPVMLKFPTYSAQGWNLSRFSGIGLGDIAVPGLYLALLLRYDLSKPKVDFHFFKIGMLSYTFALVLTNIACVYTQSGQPAFFFIVPIFFLSTFITSLFKGETKQLLDFRVKEDDEEEIDSKKID